MNSEEYCELKRNTNNKNVKRSFILKTLLNSISIVPLFKFFNILLFAFEK